MKFNIKLWLPIVVVYTVFFSGTQTYLALTTDQEIEPTKNLRKWF